MAWKLSYKLNKHYQRARRNSQMRLSALSFGTVLFAHAIEHDIKLTAASGLFLFPLREKELVYRYVKQGYKLIQNLQTWVLPLLLMDAIYRDAMFRLSANWLQEIPFAFLAALIACPKALKSNFSLFCFIIISPNHIVYFISFSRCDYKHHSMDRNRAYYTLATIRLSDYNCIDTVWRKDGYVRTQKSLLTGARRL